MLRTIPGARETIVNKTKLVLMEITLKSGEPNNKTNISDGGKSYTVKIS